MVGPGLPALLTAVLVAAITIGQVALEALTAARADRRLRVVVGERIRASGDRWPCDHLMAMGDPEPRTTGCEECMTQGELWVRLRLCTACGHVGLLRRLQAHPRQPPRRRDRPPGHPLAGA